MTIAFRSGTIAGMFTVGMGLIGATIIFMIFKERAEEVLLGFGFGGCLLALFMRVGGGIYTKAADVGADLVGKVEAGIPEDDPRNAAVIAETNAPGLDFEPSQGTHFFHLITAGGIVYMAVLPDHGDAINRELLASMPVELEDEQVLLLKPEQPLEVVVDGRTGQGIVYVTEKPKPQAFVPDWEAGDFD